MTREDLDALELADQEALHERRERLRAMTDRIMEAMDTFPPPKSHLEAGRCLRAIAATDRTLVQLYSPARRTRPRKKQKPAQTSLSLEGLAEPMGRGEGVVARGEAPSAPTPTPRPAVQSATKARLAVSTGLGLIAPAMTEAALLPFPASVMQMPFRPPRPG